MRHVLALAMGMLCVFDAPVRADAEAGRVLAEKWCSACHLVSAEGPGRDIGPPFASMDDIPFEGLRSWIMNPHPQMPRLDLTDEQVTEIVAHIRQLSAAN